MTSRNLYLYEVVDVVGQGQYDYMEHLWKDPVLRMPEMFGLQGSFYVCAAGRRPLAPGDQHLGHRLEGLDGLGVERRPHEPQAPQGVLRRLVGRGGEVAYRRLRPAVRRGARQPDHRGDQGGRASRARCSSTRSSPCARAARSTSSPRSPRSRKPLMAEYGHHATGLYEVTSNQHEVVMVWATDIAVERAAGTRTATRPAASATRATADDRIVAWEQVSARVRHRRRHPHHDAAAAHRLRTRRLGRRLPRRLAQRPAISGITGSGCGGPSGRGSG